MSNEIFTAYNSLRMGRSLAPISATLSRYKAKAKLDRSLALRSHKDTKQAC